MKAVKIPGPDHPITVTSEARRVTVTLNGEIIAQTTLALALKEASYPAMYYIPRADANMDRLTRTAHATYCPYKGDCAYFTIEAGGTTLENAVWTYENPYAAVAQIKDHLAFYPNRVEIDVAPL